MKKVFVMAALVLSSSVCSFAASTAEAELNVENPSEMMAVKKTTKKKTTTKKTTTSTKKTTTSTKAATTSSAATTTTTPTTATTATSTSSTKSTAASAVAGILGGLLGGSSSSSSSSSSTTGNVISSILNNVIGSGSFTQSDLCASTWKYKSPGCAFTSENLLAKAGGELVSSKIESQLSTYYSKVGFSNSNTYFKFSTDGSFESKIDGKSWKGTYTFDESTNAIQLKGLLLNISGYDTKNSNGISLLFESKKLLTLLQTLTALSGNSTLSTIGNISKSYDGVRIGFDMTK